MIPRLAQNVTPVESYVPRIKPVPQLEHRPFIQISQIFQLTFDFSGSQMIVDKVFL